MAELPRTIHDLEQEFARLSVEIPESPTRRAISVLHGIVMEMWRNLQDGYAQPYGDGHGNGAGPAAVFPDVAELYRTAPPMEAPAINEPLPVGTPAPRLRCATRPVSSCGWRTSAAARS